jgi:hypothetical protein
MHAEWIRDDYAPADGGKAAGNIDPDGKSPERQQYGPGIASVGNDGGLRFIAKDILLAMAQRVAAVCRE